MKTAWFGLFTGVIIGILASLLILRDSPRAMAAGNDRYQDYVICTGMASNNPKTPTDGVWLLDYRSGKLLGSIIDRNQGKILGWAEMDLVTEFGIPPRQDVHFMMTTGNITAGQSALYIAEVNTGKFGVYSLGTNPAGTGFTIQRHDQIPFRAPQKANN